MVSQKKVSVKNITKSTIGGFPGAVGAKITSVNQVNMLVDFSIKVFIYVTSSVEAMFKPPATS